MILVLWRTGPDDDGFQEWQDLLATLAVFALPLRIVIAGHAASMLDHAQMQQRLQLLADLDIKEVLVCGNSVVATAGLPLLRAIDNLTLARLSGECRHLVHC